MASRDCIEWYVVDAIVSTLVITVAIAISPIFLILIFAIVLNIVADRPYCYLPRDGQLETKL